MLAGTHALAGAIIASQVTSPVVGYSLALLSHPFLDLFPHWDFNTRHKDQSTFTIIWTSLADAGVGFALGYVLFGSTVDWKVLTITMLMAQLPDWLEAPYHVFKWNFPPFSTIKKLQHYWHTKLDWPWGFLPQIGMIIIAYCISLNK